MATPHALGRPQGHSRMHAQAHAATSSYAYIPSQMPMALTPDTAPGTFYTARCTIQIYNQTYRSRGIISPESPEPG